MPHKSTSERLAEAMERTRRNWEADRRAVAEAKAAPSSVPSPRGFTIAVSREAGTNGPAIAHAVGERLDWPVYDRELLQLVAEEMGLRARLLESVDEKRKGWLQECLETLSSTAAVSGSGYVRHLLETLFSLAAHGQCVIVGRGAAQVLPKATTLRVRLVGAVDDRIDAIRQRLGIAPEEAARWVNKTDGDRERFVKEFFLKDAADPRGYDVVLNAARFAIPDCANLIVEALHRLQARSPAKNPSLATWASER